MSQLAKAEPLPTAEFLFLRAPLYAAYSLQSVSKEIADQEEKTRALVNSGGGTRPSGGASTLGHDEVRAAQRAKEELILNRLRTVKEFTRSLDAYCVACGRESVFVLFSTTENRSYGTDSHDDSFFTKVFRCSRWSGHLLHFAFRTLGGPNLPRGLVKIGQDPSLRDLATGELSRFRPVLSEADLHEFRAAVGLASHGIGAGGLVYLRRIVERLLEAARVSAAKEPGWDADAYRKLRVGERISLLTPQLPHSLAENRSVYGVLSTAIHELTEDACRAHFPVVRAALEEVFEELLAKHIREQKAAQTKRELEAVAQRIKTPSPVADTE